MGYESSAERWSPVQSVEKILLSVVSMLAGKFPTQIFLEAFKQSQKNSLTQNKTKITGEGQCTE